MDIEKTRQSFRPTKVKVLLVGESPPAGGSFFYFGNSNLARYTQDGFCEAYGVNYSSPMAFLNAFKTNGFYLADLCLAPVNHMDSVSRRKMHKESVDDFSVRLSNMSPEAVITVVRSIRKHVEKALSMAGLSSVPYYSLPFPAMSHQHRYSAELSKTLHGLEKMRIISAHVK
jgi:hypothetical protein